MIPKGMATMLKAMGIDPENIKREFETAANTFKEFVGRIGHRADQIDARLARIEKHLGIKEADIIHIEQQKGNGHGN